MDDLTELDNNYRKAIKADFFTEDGKPCVGQELFIHGYHSNLYERYVIGGKKEKNVWDVSDDIFTIDKIEPWLSDGRVFVHKERNRFSKSINKPINHKLKYTEL